MAHNHNPNQLEDINKFGVKETSIYTELINLYGEDNKQLEAGDMCLFLLTNISEYFLPIIGRGKVLFSKFMSGQERKYYICPVEFIDDSQIMETFAYNKTYSVYVMKNIDSSYKLFGNPRNTILTKKEFESLKLSTDSNFFSHNDYYRTFGINCFFVRGYMTSDQNHYQKQLRNIIEFRKEYIEYMKDDMVRNIIKIDNMLNIQESTKFQQQCTSLLG